MRDWQFGKQGMLRGAYSPGDKPGANRKTQILRTNEDQNPFSAGYGRARRRNFYIHVKNLILQLFALVSIWIKLQNLLEHMFGVWNEQVPPVVQIFASDYAVVGKLRQHIP